MKYPFANILSLDIDPSGIYGGILHYGLIIFLVGSAFLIFLYCWLKGRLDMDEEPKMQMMRSEEIIVVEDHESFKS